MGEWIDRGFAYKGGKSGNGKGPGLVLLMEAYGVNDHIRELTGRFSGWGMTVVAPDLYHRLPAERRIVSYTDREAALSNLARVRDAEVRQDILRAIAILKQDILVDSDRIGIVGYCMGGRLAFLSSEWFAGTLRATVCFYGGGIGTPVGRFPGQTEVPLRHVAEINSPLLLIYGEEDTNIPESARNDVSKALSEAKKDFQMITYPGAGHGFFCPDRPSWHEASAHLAEKVLQEFLVTRL